MIFQFSMEFPFLFSVCEQKRLVLTLTKYALSFSLKILNAGWKFIVCLSYVNDRMEQMTFGPKVTPKARTSCAVD